MFFTCDKLNSDFDVTNNFPFVIDKVSLMRNVNWVEQILQVNYRSTQSNSTQNCTTERLRKHASFYRNFS